MQGVHDLVSTRLLSTRGGTIIIGGLAALLAGAVLLVYLNRYRSSLDTAAQPVPVLVANRFIEQGTSAEALTKRELFQVRDIPRDQVQDGAVTDAAMLRGRVALEDVLPGQQLTVAAFSTTASNALGARLIAHQRAIAVPVDPANGIIGHLEAGDRVDVYGAFNVEEGGGEVRLVSLLAQNVAVLDAPTDDAKAAMKGGHVVLRVGSLPSAKLAYTVENGKLWFVLRPRTGATSTPPSVTRLRQVLYGVRPIPVSPRSERP